MDSQSPDKIDSFTGEYSFLSNFYHHDGTTVEHIFQAMKAHNLEDAEWVLAAPTPGQAKRRGRKVTMRSDWEDIKIEVMRACLRAKFFEDPELADKLLATGDAELIEGNHWGDRFWGVCEGEGENHLGKLLMEIREELREEFPQT